MVSERATGVAVVSEGAGVAVLGEGDRIAASGDGWVVGAAEDSAGVVAFEGRAPAVLLLVVGGMSVRVKVGEESKRSERRRQGRELSRLFVTKGSSGSGFCRYGEPVISPSKH